MSNIIYKFGTDINTGMFDKAIVGGKGAKLAEMGSLGLPVPFGVTITTVECNKYLSSTNNEELIASLVDQVLSAYSDKEYMPLVSVRSGARVSMPGMMDTVLNVGINSANITTWADRLGGLAAAEDCYARLIKMYSEVVIGIPVVAFELADSYKGMLTIYKELTGSTFPQCIEDQLAGCIAAVFDSWNSERAIAYRAIHGYSSDWGTAVNVQKMVFGNRNDKSCAGVMFTRDFNTGAKTPIVDWLPNAQGEDVVAGTHDTKNLDDLTVWNKDIASQLVDLGHNMEKHYNDMQDMEFTVDNGELFVLQTRDGKRAALAAFQIAWDMHKEGTVWKKEALRRVTAKQYIALSAPTIDPSFATAACFEGIGAAGNIVTGIAVATSAAAVNCTEDCILVTKETNPSDFPGMAASVGILTQTGGITSHAAVVARGMDKTCVVGASGMKVSDLIGQHITINGDSGEVWVDQDVPVVVGQPPSFVEEMIKWAGKTDDRFLAVQPESIPTGSFVYVDVSGHLNLQKTLGAALTTAKDSGSMGVIGFGLNNEVMASDADFMGFFGVTSDSYSQAVSLIITKVLHQQKWTKKFKQNWTLHLPTGFDSVTIDSIRNQGWRVVTVVDCFKNALKVDGFVVMSPTFIKQLETEDMTFSDIEELVVKGGGTVKELPSRVTKERLLFDVLGG